MEQRDGEQVGDTQYACRNVVASFASAFKFGVETA